MRQIKFLVVLAVLLFGGLTGVWAVPAAPPAVFTAERDAAFKRFVSDSIRRYDAQGGLRLYDAVQKKTWTLRLVRLKEETLEHQGRQGFIILGEFKPVEGGKDVLDIRFDADWEETLWDMEKISIQSINGRVQPK